jgi:dihydrofolate reductase
MNFIVSVDEEWNIGSRGGLLQRIPEDMKQFRAKTVNHVIVLGRRTLETFPGGKPLPDRTNIVLTRQSDYQAEGAVVCSSYPELFCILQNYPDNDIFVVGGGEVYNVLIPYCITGYVTKIHQSYPADTRIPDLDKQENWRAVSTDGPHHSKADVLYTYVEYRNSHVQPLPQD